VDRPVLTFGSGAVTMVKESKAPAGMVRIELATPKSQTTPVHLYGLTGFDGLPAVPLTDFWIDKFEVTNAEYKRFVDQGGYQNICNNVGPVKLFLCELLRSLMGALVCDTLLTSALMTTARL
jgi:formylglycine-generating enzyme required for sulfatase activity